MDNYVVLDHSMTPDDLKGLRECCQSDAAFERLQQILLRAEADRQQTELQTLELLGDRIRSAISAVDQGHYLKSLEGLIVDRTTELLNAHQQLRQEIAERQWAEKALQESEQRFRSLIENATDIIVILDEKGIFRYCSPSAERVIGYTLSDVIGRSATEFVHPDDVAVILQVLQAAILQPCIRQPTIEYRVRHRNGSWCLFEAVATSLLDNPAIQGVVINCHDITERKQAEEGLRQQAERERLLATISQRVRQSLNLEEILNTTVVEVRQFLKADRVLTCRIEPNGRGRVIAESVAESQESCIGLSTEDSWFQQFKQGFGSGKKFAINDVQRTRLPGEFRAFLTRQQVKALLVVPILHEEQLWGVLVVSQRSTARHWEAFEVDLLEQLATQVAIAIQQSGLYRQVQQLNAKLEGQVQERTAQLQQTLEFEAMVNRMTDAVRNSLNEDEILQTAVQELAISLDVLGCDAALHNLEQQSATIQHEFINSEILPAAKGSVVQMRDFSDIFGHLLQANPVQFCRIAPSRVRPLKTACTILACPIVDDQDVLGALWLFKLREASFENQEIRVVQQVANQCAIAIRQARLFQAAQAQVSALEELNQLKDDFLSTVSHELRTPVSNMKMAIHMLRSVTAPERQARYLDILQAECVREIELINDLLDLQRLEASSYPVCLEPIDLQQFLGGLIEPFQSRMHERQQVLALNIASNLPTLTTDQVSLERILAELLNNACKYTSPGGNVVLSVQSNGAAAANGTPHVTFTVCNQAQIPPEELPRIFEKFYRVVAGDRWKQGGTGLGLALVQKLVLQLGGNISVQSYDGWTTFTVRLPTSSPLQ